MTPSLDDFSSTLGLDTGHSFLPEINVECFSSESSEEQDPNEFLTSSTFVDSFPEGFERPVPKVDLHGPSTPIVSPMQYFSDGLDIDFNVDTTHLNVNQDDLGLDWLSEARFVFSVSIECTKY